MEKVPMPEIGEDIVRLVDDAERACAQAFERVERVERINTQKVLRALQRHRVSLRHFAPTTGYGYDDIGRDTLSAIFAEVMGCEAALVRPQMVSGTHALALCLYGLLRPGDLLLSAAGKPYDTLEQVIGLTGAPGEGSLKDYGIGYRQVELNSQGGLDVPAVLDALEERVRVVWIQRSRGYDWRPSLSLEQIGEAAEAIHRARPDVWVVVDNCYGEFTGLQEPGDVGVDLMAGSLIKNPGGGLAPTGGYVAGKQALVDKVAYRLTSPGIGAEVGSNASGYQPYYQGLFLAPHTVAQAVKTAILASRVFESLGFPVHPGYQDPRHDIIQAVRFDDANKLISFIQAIQCCSPVDSEALPEPWEMPGYQDPVIMAAGTFVAGASIELSADAPIRPPYIGYLQGGLSYAHGRLGVEGAVARMRAQGLISL